MLGLQVEPQPQAAGDSQHYSGEGEVLPCRLCPLDRAACSMHSLLHSCTAQSAWAGVSIGAGAQVLLRMEFISQGQARVHMLLWTLADLARQPWPSGRPNWCI